MARVVGNIYVSAVLQRVVVNFQRIRQGVLRCLTLSSYTMAANCAPGAKSVVHECLVANCNLTSDEHAVHSGTDVGNSSSSTTVHLRRRSTYTLSKRSRLGFWS